MIDFAEIDEEDYKEVDLYDVRKELDKRGIPISEVSELARSQDIFHPAMYDENDRQYKIDKWGLRLTKVIGYGVTTILGAELLTIASGSYKIGIAGSMLANLGLFGANESAQSREEDAFFHRHLKPKYNLEEDLGREDLF